MDKALPRKLNSNPRWSRHLANNRALEHQKAETDRLWCPGVLHRNKEGPLNERRTTDDHTRRWAKGPGNFDSPFYHFYRIKWPLPRAKNGKCQKMTKNSFCENHQTDSLKFCWKSLVFSYDRKSKKKWAKKGRHFPKSSKMGVKT